MDWDRVIGGFCITVGLSLLAGFFTQFRQRGYVGLLGFCFLSLAVASFLAHVTKNGRNAAFIIAGIFFLLSLISAVLQTHARIAAIRRSHKAMEEQMIAMLEVDRERNKNKNV